MKRIVGLACGLFALLALAACVQYPLGMTEEEWLLLTPAEQQEARLADAELRRVQALQAAAEAEARALAERNRVIDAYRNARPGDIAYCDIDPPEGRFSRVWVQPSSVTLVNGEQRRLQVLLENPRRSEYVWLSRDRGGRIELCDSTLIGSGPSGVCDSIWSLDMQFGREASTRISWTTPLSGGRLTCGRVGGFGPPFGLPDYLL